MLPAWRKSFLGKLEDKALRDEELGIVHRATVYDKLARREAPSGLSGAASAPLGDQMAKTETKTMAAKKSADLRRVFDRIDNDKDGFINAADLRTTYKKLWTKEPKLRHACPGFPGQPSIERIIFESDDDCDGVIGWEEFCNLWVRLKKPLGVEEKDRPFDLFNLVDFLHQDIIHGNDMRAINSNKMLQLFHFRYQRVAALEVMTDVSVGETSSDGVSYPNFLLRDDKLRKVMFASMTYGALEKADLRELHVSHGKGLSGTLRRIRPPTAEQCLSSRLVSVAMNGERPFSQLASRMSATDRRQRPAVTMSMEDLFAGLPLSSRSPSRQHKWVVGGLNGSTVRPRRGSKSSSAEDSSPRSLLGSAGRRRGGGGGRHSRSSIDLSRHSRGTSTLSKMPKMSAELRKVRQKERAQLQKRHATQMGSTPKGERNAVEVREKVDTDFLGGFAVSLNEDPDAENWFCVLYGPLMVRAKPEGKALRVGQLNAGDVVRVFEKHQGDAQGGLALRVDLGWIGVLAKNGRMAVEKLEPSDTRHPAHKPVHHIAHSALSGMLPRVDTPEEEAEDNGLPIGHLGPGSPHFMSTMSSMSPQSHGSPNESSGFGVKWQPEGANDIYSW